MYGNKHTNMRASNTCATGGADNGPYTHSTHTLSNTHTQRHTQYANTHHYLHARTFSSPAGADPALCLAPAGAGAAEMVDIVCTPPDLSVSERRRGSGAAAAARATSRAPPMVFTTPLRFVKLTSSSPSRRSGPLLAREDTVRTEPCTICTTHRKTRGRDQPLLPKRLGMPFPWWSNHTHTTRAYNLCWGLDGTSAFLTWRMPPPPPAPPSPPPLGPSPGGAAREDGACPCTVAPSFTRFRVVKWPYMPGR
jgi:hypothetical protein